MKAKSQVGWSCAPVQTTPAERQGWPWQQFSPNIYTTLYIYIYKIYYQLYIYIGICTNQILRTGPNDSPSAARLALVVARLAVRRAVLEEKRSEASAFGEYQKEGVIKKELSAD